MAISNRRFARALDHLYQHKLVKDQKELAAMTGITETTISRILNDKVRHPSDESVRKLSLCFPGVFNPEWLRGEDAAPMLANDEHQAEPQQQEPHMDHSSLVNALVAAKDDLVAAIQSELTAKNDHIATLKERLQEYRRIIDSHTTGYPYPIGAAESDNQQVK